MDGFRPGTETPEWATMLVWAILFLSHKISWCKITGTEGEKKNSRRSKSTDLIKLALITLTCTNQCTYSLPHAYCATQMNCTSCSIEPTMLQHNNWEDLYSSCREECEKCSKHQVCHFVPCSPQLLGCLQKEATVIFQRLIYILTCIVNSEPAAKIGLTAYPRASDCINTIIKVPTVSARMCDAQYNTSDVAGVAYRTSAANTMYTTHMQMHKQSISNRFT